MKSKLKAPPQRKFAVIVKMNDGRNILKELNHLLKLRGFSVHFVDYRPRKMQSPYKYVTLWDNPKPKTRGRKSSPKARTIEVWVVQKQPCEDDRVLFRKEISARDAR